MATSRLVFIDRLRGWAVIVMIETHVFNALLKPSLREGTFFNILNFINGLVAPSFLFCAGLALAITLQKRWQEFITLERSLWRYVIRLLFILVVGYSLHLPFFSFARMMHETDEQGWNLFFQSDILHVISMTILLLLCLFLVTRNQKLSLWIAGILALAVVFCSPLVRETDVVALPAWLRPYVTAKATTLFPLFPWSAFLISGTLIGVWYLQVKESLSERSAMKKLSQFSILALLIALLVEILPITLYPHHDFWNASPEFFFVRLGIVVLCLSGLWRYGQSRPSANGTSHSFTPIFGQESLLVYVTHLLIIYGQDYDWNLIRYYGASLNYIECFGIFMALTIGMGVLAYGWHFLKGWNKRTASVLQFTILAGIMLKFLLK